MLLAANPGGSTQRLDFAAVALNVLPPGESGDLRFPPASTNQLPLDDGLTARTSISSRDLTRYFKSQRFGVTGTVVRVERPRRGLRILRDRWDVPHVYGHTRADVEFGAWTVTDVIALGSLLGANLGVGGGD